MLNIKFKLIVLNNNVSAVIKKDINKRLILLLKLILKEVSFLILKYRIIKYRSRVIKIAIIKLFVFIDGIVDKIIIRIIRKILKIVLTINKSFDLPKAWYMDDSGACR